MSSTRPKAPRAPRIRALLAAGLAPTEIRASTGASLQAVRDADLARKPRGRPPAGMQRITLHVSAATAAWLRAESKRCGCTLGDVVESEIGR